MRIAIFSILAFLLSCNQESAKGPSFVYKESDSSGKVLSVDGESFNADQVFGDIQGDVFQKEMELYQLKLDRIKAFMLQKIVENDPRKNELTNDEFLEKYIVSDLKPSRQDIQNFIDERQIPADQVTDDMREKISAYLSVGLKKEAVDQWLSKQSKNKKVEIHLEKPRRPYFEVTINDDDAVWGNKQAKVTIVEFSDFQCPFCARGRDRVNELKKKYPKDIKVVYKHFPLPFHRNAKDASIASLCLKEQKAEKFWDYYNDLFNNQQALLPTNLIEYAKKYSIDEEKFKTCLESKKYLAQVERDIELGKRLFVKSTPTFFVNGRLIQGAEDISVFEEEIKAATP